MFISIHALREEGDGSDLHQSTLVGLFQSTPSARRATPFMFHSTSKPLYFNPRPPRGGRQRANVVGGRTQEFQSTPSARRATVFFQTCSLFFSYFNPRPPRGGRLVFSVVFVHKGFISIHALREEGDHGDHQHPDSERISIHALREEGDFEFVCLLVQGVQFQSTPSARRATLRYSF